MKLLDEFKTFPLSVKIAVILSAIWLLALVLCVIYVVRLA